MLISLASLAVWNLNYGIDFVGGSLLEISFSQDRPTSEEMIEKLSDFDLGSVNLQPAEDNSFVLRFKEIDEDTHQTVISSLKEGFETDARQMTEERFESIGPVIGRELKTKSIYSIIVILLAITIYIAWAFRRVSWPVASWKYGLTAIITLFHDVLIVMGVFVFLGRFLGVEINTAFVAALLTILGYSVNDTIVVFDRIRENLTRSREDFETIVNISVNETINRSVNTSLTTFLVLIAIFLFGGATIKYFVLALICGVIIGTYSSIFVASPLLVWWFKRLK